MSKLSIPRNNRILIVDDNQAIHEDFRKILAPDTGSTETLDEAEFALFDQIDAPAAKHEYELVFALQGQEALEKVQDPIKADQPSPWHSWMCACPRAGTESKPPRTSGRLLPTCKW